ncbi:hypothetical protein BDZ89DRAFT_1078313 [Hymenopellis radicata]|nr:hypothetical protein BDZ89DRAFT_1078313 [Hymenopellis radicata]
MPVVAARAFGSALSVGLAIQIFSLAPCGGGGVRMGFSSSCRRRFCGWVQATDYAIESFIHRLV